MLVVTWFATLFNLFARLRSYLSACSCTFAAIATRSWRRDMPFETVRLVKNTFCLKVGVRGWKSRAVAKTNERIAFLGGNFELDQRSVLGLCGGCDRDSIARPCLLVNWRRSSGSRSLGRLVGARMELFAPLCDRCRLDLGFLFFVQRPAPNKPCVQLFLWALCKSGRFGTSMAFLTNS